MMLSPSDRSRLIGLLGMCGSDHIGERANAASLADKFLRERRLSWANVVLPNVAPLVQTPRPAPSPWRETVAKCRATQGNLSPWEQQFLARLDGFPSPSAKQAAILQEIAVRLGVVEAPDSKRARHGGAR